MNMRLGRSREGGVKLRMTDARINVGETGWLSRQLSLLVARVATGGDAADRATVRPMPRAPEYDEIVARRPALVQRPTAMNCNPTECHRTMRLHIDVLYLLTKPQWSLDRTCDLRS